MQTQQGNNNYLLFKILKIYTYLLLHLQSKQFWNKWIDFSNLNSAVFQRGSKHKWNVFPMKFQLCHLLTLLLSHLGLLIQCLADNVFPLSLKNKKIFGTLLLLLFMCTFLLKILIMFYEFEIFGFLVFGWKWWRKYYANTVI